MFIYRYTPRNIGDSIWLDDGTLVIGSGNQLFTLDKKLDSHSAITNLHLTSHKLPLKNIFDVVSVLNGPLPVYHPQFLTQSVFAGKTEPVRKVLVYLLKELRFKVLGDSNIADIDSSLDMDIEDFLQPPESVSCSDIKFRIQLTFRFFSFTGPTIRCADQSN